MAQLRITDSADVERATLSIANYSIKREGFNVIAEADVAVSRDDLNDIIDLTPGEDRAYIEVGGTDVFGGIVRAPERQGGISVLKIRGKEQYFVRAPSVPTGQQRVGTDDSTLIQECINATPQLTAGTIETVEAGQTWVFGGISQWEKATQVANAAGGELTVTPDGTVDYRAQIGSDKTATTLSPANASFVEDTFVVSRDGVSGNTTHLLVTGVGQGTGQVEVAIVPADDTTTHNQYDRVETYTNPNWADGDPAIWGTPRGNKDLKNPDAAAAYGLTLIEELQNEEIRVDTRVKGHTVNLGDRYHVRHPEEDVDENLRAVEVVEMLAAKGGTRYEVVFSNYEFAHRDPGREDHYDARRYAASAYEGDLTQIQQGPGRGPVNVGHDYEIHVFYPSDVVAEVNAQLLVKGTNYRAFSQGAASGGDVTSASGAGEGAQTDPDTVTFSSTGGGFNTQFDLPTVTGDSAWAWVYVLVQNQPGSNTANGTLDIYNLTKGTYFFDDTGGFSLAPGESILYQAQQTGPTVEGDTVELQFNQSDTLAVDMRFAYGALVTSAHTHDVPSHTHDPNPGILDWDGTDQTPEHYPENVDVIVNGVSQGLTLGDGLGEFEATVDLAGDLSAGWNEIRLTSDSLGHLDATFSADLFRQSL